MSGKRKQPAPVAAAAPQTKGKAAAKGTNPKAPAASVASAPTASPAVSGYRNEYRGFVTTPAGAPIAVEDCAGSQGKPALSAERFYSEYILARRPVVLRHFASSPASAEFASLMRSWPDPATLRHLAGQAPVRIEWAERARNAEGFGRGQHEWMRFEQFLALLGCDDTAVRAKLSKAERAAHDELMARHKQHALYLTSQPIPEDAADGTPDALCAEPVSSLLAHMPLRPKLFEKLAPIQYNLWMGGFREANDSASSAAAAAESPAPRGSPFYRSAGTSSGLHHDYHDNAYILLKGAKTFHLFPPNQAPNLYAHGMKGAEDPSVDEDDKPQCIIHPNGVIEYVAASDAASTAGDNEGASTKAQRQLEEEAMADEEEDEDADAEEEEEESAEPSAEDAEDAAALAAYESKHAAISAQIAELKATLQTVRRNFDLTPETDLKRRKNLGIELTNVEKKLPALSARLNKTEADEVVRLKAVSDRVAAAEADDDDDDSDEDDFPSDLDVDNLRDDYQDSDANDDDEEEEDEEEEDAKPAKSSAKLPTKQKQGTKQALAALMAQMEDDADDDDDDEDAAIDPAERAAWEAFMANAAAASKNKKNKAGGKAAAPAAAAKGKRKEPATAAAAAASSSSLAEATSSKKQKTAASASPASSASTAAASSSSASAEVFPPNFSRLDFARVSAADLARAFPRFRAANGAIPSVVHVAAGDVLYLPASWWHEVFSRSAPEDDDASAAEGERMPSEVHMALNYWFHPPSSTTASPSCAYTGADVEWEQRFKTHYEPAALKEKHKSTATLAQMQQHKQTKPSKAAAAASSSSPTVPSASAKKQQPAPSQPKPKQAAAAAGASAKQSSKAASARK